MGRYKLRPRNPHGLVSPNRKYTSIHLRLLSPELRDVIFTYSICRSNGKTPPFLIALRPDQELCYQAIRIHYAFNELEVSWGMGLEWLAFMRESTRGLVRRVVVVVPTTQTSIHRLHDALSLLPGLTSLKVRATTTAALQRFDLASRFQSSLSPSFPHLNSKSNFKSLTKLTIEARLKIGQYPGDGAVFSSAMQRVGDVWGGMVDLDRFKAGLVGVLGSEPEERFVNSGMGVRMVILSWEKARGEVLLG